LVISLQRQQMLMLTRLLLGLCAQNSCNNLLTD
jgi:hypothetical protein